MAHEIFVVACGLSSCDVWTQELQCRDLVAWWGMEPLSSSLETWSTREVWNPLMFKSVVSDSNWWEEDTWNKVWSGYLLIYVCMLTVPDCSVTPMNCSPLGCSVHGMSEEGILEWVAILLLQGIFTTQGSNPHLLCLRYLQACSLPLVPPGKPWSGSWPPKPSWQGKCL